MPGSPARDTPLPGRFDAVASCWLALTLALFVAMRPGWEMPGRIPREYVLIVGVALLALLRLPGVRRAPLFTPVTLLALVYGGSGLLGLTLVPAAARLDVLWSLAPLGALWGVAIMASRSVGAPAGEAGAERGLVLGAALGCGIVGALALAQSYLGFDMLPQARQPAATFMQRNVLGQVLVLALPLAIGAALRAPGALLRWAAFLGASLGAAALVATRSRGSWIALSCALALGLALALLRRAPWRAPVAAGLALMALAALLAGAVPPPAERRLPSVLRSVELLAYPGESSLTTRAALAANTLEMAAASPLLGHGAGRFGSLYPLFHDAARPTPGFGLEKRPEHAHNEFLHAFAELGFPAALALGVLFAGALLRASRRALRDPRPRVALWNGVSAAALFGVVVHAQGSFPLRSPASAFLAFALAGVAWRPSARVTTRAGKAGGTSRNRLPVELVLLAALVPAIAAIPYDASRQEALGLSLEAYAAGDAARAAQLALAPGGHRFRARTRGLASMLLFETEKDARLTLPTLEGALAGDPHNLNLLLATGARRLKLGDAQGALEAFRHALRIDDSLGRAWLGVAMGELERGDRAEASRACLRALRSDPAPPAAEVFCLGNRLVSTN